MRLLITACIILTGCSIINQRSVYEGVRATQKAKSAGSASGQKDLPPYDQYEKERDTLTK